MLCANCGQATVKGTAWGTTFIPCSCPIDHESENKRLELLWKRLDEAQVRISAAGFGLGKNESK